MMMEYEETMQRLAACGIKATVQFFGSARAKDRQQYDASHAELTAQVNASAPGSPEAKTAQTALERLESMEWMIEYLDKTRELARRLTEWSIRSRLSRNASISGVSRNKSLAKIDEEAAAEAAAGGWQGEREHGGDDNQPFRYLPHATDLKLSGRDQDTYGGLYVCTGGAGGFMEAANRGAADVPNGRSIGMGISLPFETGLNPYVTPELAFEYHCEVQWARTCTLAFSFEPSRKIELRPGCSLLMSRHLTSPADVPPVSTPPLADFFTRKLCMAFHMQALVVAPGGFGTCDEMFEMMTLKQTGKMQSGLPIVLLGKAYWRKVLNWEAFAEMGTIAKRDVDELLFTDDVDEAFDYITERLGALMGSPVRRS